jgi:CTP:molybdopterin cytidylyltransferase MocA
MGGLVLAAGAGRRFGGPKGLARDDQGTPWVALAVRMLRQAGCADVLVAVGAAADEVAALVPSAARSIVTPWREGLGAVLRTGIAQAADRDCDIVVITPVDTPDAPSSAVDRVVAALGQNPASGLARAVYQSMPGHPVVVGREHFAALAASLEGDRGAKEYLDAHGVIEVECADLWTGTDIDRR